jgi:hypothetical protein
MVIVVIEHPGENDRPHQVKKKENFHDSPLSFRKWKRA